MLMQRLPPTDPGMIAGIFRDLAAADCDVNSSEIRLMSGLLPGLGMAQDQVAGFLASLGLVDDRQLEACLSLLGLSGRPSAAELMQAWRRAMKDFHPDRYQGSELPAAVKAMIVEKGAAINAAYDALRKAYGYGES